MIMVIDKVSKPHVLKEDWMKDVDHEEQVLSTYKGLLWQKKQNWNRSFLCWGKLMILAPLRSTSFRTMLRWLKELKELRTWRSRASSPTFMLHRAPSHLLSSLLFLDIFSALLIFWQNSASPFFGRWYCKMDPAWSSPLVGLWCVFFVVVLVSLPFSIELLFLWKKKKGMLGPKSEMAPKFWGKQISFRHDACSSQIIPREF